MDENTERGTPSPETGTGLLLSDDLLFISRIAGTARALGDAGRPKAETAVSGRFG